MGSCDLTAWRVWKTFVTRGCHACTWISSHKGYRCRLIQIRLFYRGGFWGWHWKLNRFIFSRCRFTCTFFVLRTRRAVPCWGIVIVFVIYTSGRPGWGRLSCGLIAWELGGAWCSLVFVWAIWFVFCEWNVSVTFRLGWRVRFWGIGFGEFMLILIMVLMLVGINMGHWEMVFMVWQFKTTEGGDVLIHLLPMGCGQFTCEKGKWSES